MSGTRWRVENDTEGPAWVQGKESHCEAKHFKLNANSELKCVKCNGCMLSDNHDLCVLDFINNVNARNKSKSRPTGRTFTIVGNACPLTRITTTTEVPLRKPTALENETPKPVVTLVYLRKPRKSKTNVPVSKSKVIQILFTPPRSVDLPAPEVIAPIDEVVAPVPVVSTGSTSSTTVDQDAPSPSNSQTTPETQPPVIPNDVEENNHDIKVAHMGNDPYFDIPIPEGLSDQSSSTDSTHIIVHPDHQISEHNSKWTKDHPLENIIGKLARPVSTRL
ncbi:hypothetical protein Tco_0688279 [Tanacetum coccineum]